MQLFSTTIHSDVKFKNINEPNKAVCMTSSDITVWKQVRIRFTQDLFSWHEKEVMKCLCDLKHKK